MMKLLAVILVLLCVGFIGEARELPRQLQQAAAAPQAQRNCASDANTFVDPSLVPNFQQVLSAARLAFDEAMLTKKR
jgi:hypothetical protein